MCLQIGFLYRVDAHIFDEPAMVIDVLEFVFSVLNGYVYRDSYKGFCTFVFR